MPRVLAVFLFLAGSALAQQTQLIPDCDIPFTFTAAGQVTPNATCGHNLIGIYDWQLVYYADNFGGITLTVQSAPDNNGAPGTWTTFAGTVVSGSNPNTAITQGSTRLQGYFPWNRINLVSATGTGTVRGHMYGCRAPGCSTAGASIPGGPPTGPAGGDLSGTYPNPTVAKVNGNTPGGTCPTGFVQSIDISGRPTCSNTMQDLTLTGFAFASLPAISNGKQYYCSDCTVTSGIDNTAAGAGSGCYINDVNGAHKCVGF